MNVRELIKALADESDLDSEVCMRFMDDNGDVQFKDVDGIANERDSYFYMSGTFRIVKTTLLAE